MSKQDVVLRALMANRTSVRTTTQCEDANAALNDVLKGVDKKELGLEAIEQTGENHPGRAFLFRGPKYVNPGEPKRAK